MDYCFITYFQDTMAAPKTQAIEVSSQRRESIFLSLSPTFSSPPSSPVLTKAVSSPPKGEVLLTADLVEPLQKTQRSSSDSSSTSTDGNFLRLGHVDEQ